jgi:serine/threonine-protein kinase
MFTLSGSRPDRYFVDMQELRDQLTAAVGGAFKIGDELGGGGMSRVFVAEDLALGRTVVIKVLHPELAAGVNAERFKREVQLAARLQHPHIVPVLSAGEVNGLPYYVMPFVKGQSLAAQLAAGPLPVADVVHVMGDVAKALAYAQSEGVVHRDIKPDNILVSGGAATVADFGIAKALSSSRRESNEGLTSVGTSLGTAAYMAPEQVAGDPSLDHRADIYALGCVAYELLTGSSPFAGRPAQQMLAAHVLEQPVPIREKRPDVPQALADIVARCMAKDPNERPQTGQAILSELDGVSLGTGSHEQIKRPSKRGLSIGLGVGVAVAAVTLFLLKGRAPAADSTSITLAVAPFEVLDPSLALWKEGLVDVLSRNLDGGASIHTVSPSSAISKWQGRVVKDDALQFAKRTGANIVIYGSLQSAGRDFVEAKTWVLDTRSTAAPIEVSVRDSSARMDRLGDSLSVRLLTAIAGERSGGSIRSLGSGSLPAIKAFLQGQQYFRRTQFDSAQASFREAIAADSAFAIAHAYLNQAYGWGGTLAQRREEGAAAKKYLKAGLSNLDSLRIAAIGQYWDQNGSVPANQAAAFKTMQATVERYPNDALSWYLLGDLRLHGDPHFSDQAALRDFTRAIEADSDFVPAYIHSAEIGMRFGPAVAERFIKPYLARNKEADPDARAKRLASQLMAPGGTTDASVRTTIDTINANILPTTFQTLVRLPDSAEAALYLGRMALRRPDVQKGAAKGFYIDMLAARGHVKEAWDSAVVNKRFIAGEIALLGLVPADSAARVMKGWIAERNEAAIAALPALMLARDTATLASTQAIVAKAKAGLPANAPPERRASFDYITQAIHAYWSLARGDSAAALKEFDSLPEAFSNVPTDQFIRARLVARTNPKRALEMLTNSRITGDLISVARELEIGRLAEKTGDTQRAVEGYNYVAEAWQNTENEQLKNAVRESRDALKRLDSDGRVRAQLSAPR